MSYFRPGNKEEALKILDEKHPRVIAGGTDLVVRMHKMMLEPENILDISMLPFKQIEFDENSSVLIIGALVTMSELAKHPLILKHAPLLAAAASSVGAPQIRNRATIGGNIANSSPAADGAAALSALNADVKIESVAGEKIIPLKEFFKGPGKNVLSPSEMLTSVIIKDCKTENTVFHWYKAGNRKAQVISMVAFAGKTVFNEDGTIKDISMALASVAPVTLRLFKTEEFLKGKKLTSEIINKAVEISDSEVTPISDVRASKEYRDHVSSVFIRRHLENRKDGKIFPSEVPEKYDKSESPLPKDNKYMYINGEKIEYKGSLDRRLLDVLREDFDFTGTKNGCGEGECGACTILLDGKPVNSCLVLAGNALGRQITTVEGLTRSDGSPGLIQQAFIDAGAIQCGFCTPGFEVTSHALVMNYDSLSKEEIKTELEGNLCRCTGYVKIIEAVELAFKRKGEGEK